MIGHTKEPWYALKQGVEIQSEDGLHEVAATAPNGTHLNVCQMFEGEFSNATPDGNDEPEYTISADEACANARRIAACVNACAGISTAALEEAATSGQRVSEMLLQQRDGLLALVIRYRNETPLGHQPHMIADLADAAIAKVTQP